MIKRGIIMKKQTLFLVILCLLMVLFGCSNKSLNNNKETGKDPIILKEPVEKTENEPVDEVTNGPVDEVTNEPVDEVTNGPVDEVTNEPVDEVTNEPVDEVTNEPQILDLSKSYYGLCSECTDEQIKDGKTVGSYAYHDVKTDFFITQATSYRLYDQYGNLLEPDINHLISTIESFDKGKIGVHEIDVFALNKDGIRITNASVSVYWQIIEWHSNINVLGQFNRTEADMLKEFVFDYRESIYPFDNTRNNGDGFQGRADYIAKEALLPITGSRSYDHTNEEIIIYSHKKC